VSNQCGDLLQSPIPLTDRGVVTKGEYSQKLRIIGLSNLPDSILVENDGHSAKFSMQFAKGQAPQLQGGPLDVPYIFDQFHFHWGSTNSYGSEHTLNGVRFPLEIHLLFYNSVYNSTAEARDRPKGLAVIGIFYDITSNPEYRPNPFSKYLFEIITPGMNVTLLDNERFSLKEVVGGPIDFSYLTYRGSLTTPPCSQSVIWIVSTRPKRISNKEVSRSQF
jgi:carbonic anhydrase